MLVFAALTVAYIVSATYANYVYNVNVASIIAEAKAMYPDRPDLASYIHFAPFWESSSGQALRIEGVAMIFFSVGFCVWTALHKAPTGDETGGQKRKTAAAAKTYPLFLLGCRFLMFSTVSTFDMAFQQAHLG